MYVDTEPDCRSVLVPFAPWLGMALPVEQTTERAVMASTSIENFSEAQEGIEVQSPSADVDRSGSRHCVE
ncbi:MAG: hypothetical protein KDD69_13670 [Bdellovibrionales bacterium]|nr:hypothetical protein [Bdellovibrionales bacterium]